MENHNYLYLNLRYHIKLLLNILSNTKGYKSNKKYIEKSMINLDIVETIESTKSLIKNKS